jgi:hypothetical protein
VQPKASREHLQMGNSWEPSWRQAGKSGISRICKTRGRQVWSHAAQRPRASTRHLESASQAAKIIQHTWKPWGTSGSVSHADQRAPTLYLATVKDKQETSAYRSKSGTPIIRWIMLTLNTNIIYIYKLCFVALNFLARHQV